MSVSIPRITTLYPLAVAISSLCLVVAACGELSTSGEPEAEQVAEAQPSEADREPEQEPEAQPSEADPEPEQEPEATDPNALVAGQPLAIPGMPSAIGSGAVSLEPGPEDQIIRATIEGALPLENGTSSEADPHFCLLCFEGVTIAPGLEVPVDLLVERIGSEYAGWVAAGPGSSFAWEYGIEEVGGFTRPSDEVVGLVVEGVFDIPLDQSSLGQTITAGPDGAVLRLTSDGVELLEGSASLIDG